ncbi:MAG: polymerase subunit gamma and tau [Massilibacillus sp.]|jgi:DNA polymerase-3 subunit gamma/tau|nr:polymerase subunit gamma and tau [Massilibacillus sp.]
MRMAYVALYRKWRPSDFSNLVGQEHISKTLVNAIHTGKIAHAYLFSGPRGTGKTSTAKILAKALNCEHGPTPSPCNKCTSCTKINAGSSMDVFEIDAASNRGIDEIRDLRETVKFAPVDGRYKVYIIDEVHMLTTEAFNALLKTLEEPPSHVVFILATTETHKVPATIHSRCQRYDFKRISVPEIVARLELVANEMNIEADTEAVKLIAIHADGGLRDALSILDQCSTLDNERITADKVRRLLGLVGHESIEKIVNQLAEKNSKEVLMILDELISRGKDVKQILSEIALYMRSVMIYQATQDINSIELYSMDEKVLVKQAELFTHDELVKNIQLMHSAINEAKWSPQPRITTEVAMLSVCNPLTVASGDTDALLKRIEKLEEKITKLSIAASHVEPVAAVVTPVYTEPPQVRTPQYNAPTAKTQGAVKPVTKPSEVPVHVVEPMASASTADAKAVWDRMLKELVNTGKRSVYACVSQGQLQSFEQGQMVIAFTAAFPKERTEKSDYKAILETILTGLCDTPTVVRCVQNSVVAPPPKAPPKPPKPKVEFDANMTPAEKHVIDEAVKMFGDNFVKKEELKD